MNSEILFELFSDIDDKFIIEARKDTHLRSVGLYAKRIIPVVAFVVCISVLAFFVPRITNFLTDYQNTETTSNLENTLKPQYVPSFAEPELDEIYMTEPYSNLLPYIIPSGMLYKKSYLSLYDEIANPNNKQILSVIFESDAGNLEIKIFEYEEDGMVADPNKPETYKLDLYYGPMEENGTPGAYLPNVFNPFIASDVTKEIVADRIYTFKDDVCKASIDIICGQYVISYSYTGTSKHTIIGADLFYECVTSSNYFKNK